MLQDIAPHIYHNPMSFVPPAPGDLALAYAGGQVLARLEEGLLQLPRVEQCTGASGWIYGFSIDERPGATGSRLFHGFQLPGSRPGANGLCLRRGREPRPVVCRKPVLRRLRQVSGAQHLGTGLGLPRLWPHCLP